MRWAVAGLLLLQAACSDPVFVSGDTLVVRRERGGLELANRSAAPVHYFIVERETAARIDWLACAGPGCPAIPARGVVFVPESLIAGFTSAADEVIVYWWHAVPAEPEGFRADSIRSLIVPL